jgi:hypothetical protein
MEATRQSLPVAHPSLAMAARSATHIAEDTII